MRSTIYSILDFLETSKEEWLNILKEHVTAVMNEIPSESQIRAWEDCFNVLQREFQKIECHQETYFVFEYELHRERGRRPDVLLLSGSVIYVLEFKQHNGYTQAQVDQADAYARDLKHYHLASHELEVKPLLILTGAHHQYIKIGNVSVASSDVLFKGFENKLQTPFVQNIDNWFNSIYEPLPSIMQAARIFYDNNDLPQIKKAASAGIPNTVSAIQDIVNNNEQRYNLILITGVPGAGKTLVGLNYVHTEKEKKATFLSGNGPLVQVLQYTLKGKEYVRDIHGYIKTHSNLDIVPPENIVVFDEAQRAWDSKQVQAKKRGTLSEPMDLIRIAENKDNFTIIALIGEGQEIYLGEESGIQLWDEAINSFAKKQWNIYGPNKLQNIFSNNYAINSNLDLTVSLRTHAAMKLQDFVNTLIDNNINSAKKAYCELKSEQYPIYLTRNLDSAKAYVIDRYREEPNKTYGLIASSKGSILKGLGVNNGFGGQPRADIYFAMSDNPRYCRKLTDCVTEFACQGLELDFPIVCWDDDLLYQNNTWIDTKPNWKANDSLQLRKNTYRVLLTRGRDGMIIFIPNEAVLNSVFELFSKFGLVEI